METIQQLEAVLVDALFRRGLPRTAGLLAFVYEGNVVRVTVDQGHDRGPVVTVHDKPYASRRFRAVDGACDWDAIANGVVDVVVRKRHASAARHSRFDGAEVPLSIRPSTSSPGGLLVKLSRMELNPGSAMQLYALVRQAIPVTAPETGLRDSAAA